MHSWQICAVSQCIQDKAVHTHLERKPNRPLWLAAAPAGPPCCGREEKAGAMRRAASSSKYARRAWERVKDTFV